MAGRRVLCALCGELGIGELHENIRTRPFAIRDLVVDGRLGDLVADFLDEGTKLDFGRFMRRRRARSPYDARYGAEFLYCLGAAET